MRLICPNCDAQYEVPDGVIPSEGRDVQCSECGQTWFQEYETEDLSDLLTADEEEDATSPSEMRMPRALADRAARQIDPDVQDILREEADREAKAREAEALESQPDLGLTAPPEPDKRVEQARQRMAKLRGEEGDDTVAAGASRRDLLPDIEEINSTLRSANDRGGASAALDLPDGEIAGERSSGFWTGFLLIVAVMAILLALYLFAPQIAQAVPQTDPWLTNYVTRADAVRSWLNTALLGALEWLEHTAAAQQE